MIMIIHHDHTNDDEHDQGLHHGDQDNDDDDALDSHSHSLIKSYES